MKEPTFPDAVRVIDSHTAGEPTRVVIEGWPAPVGDDMAARRADLASRLDDLRRAVIAEPRGHGALVGALLTEPVTAGATAGVIFFNNVGYLGMCGHGMIGVIRTLQHLGRLSVGDARIDTPVGTVTAALAADGAVTIRNVISYCHARDVGVDVTGIGVVTGDVAYGGNWFFITHLPHVALELDNLDELMDVTKRVRAALRAAHVTGADGAEIDHVELTGPGAPGIDARCFVLCPGGEYDRSPCGTGTSAKLAVLHAQGRLAAGQVWRQQSVTGGVFDGWLDQTPAGLVPYIRGRAFITGESVLRFEADDPFRAGFEVAQ